MAGVGRLDTFMPKLSFLQLIRVFAAEVLGYSVLACLLGLAFGALFPGYIKGTLDMSVGTFYEFLFLYFGVCVLIATPLMLIGAWGILRLFRKRG